MPSFLRFTGSVKVPKTTIIAVAALNAANQLGFEATMWVTSGNDGVHRPDSEHYENNALDFRTKTLAPAQKHAWRTTIKKRLGAAYDVLLEDEGGRNEHIHVEWDSARAGKRSPL